MHQTAKYETFGKRFLASLIDGIVFIPLIIIDNLIEDHVTDKQVFFSWLLFYTLCGLTYAVISHGRYGQTIGKYFMGIKVLDHVNEKEVIGYRRAFYRESIWFFTILLSLVYMAYQNSGPTVNEEMHSFYYNIVNGLFSLIWLVIELVTMLFNQRRRALHDYIAGSVVIDINLSREEDLEKRKSVVLSPSH